MQVVWKFDAREPVISQLTLIGFLNWEPLRHISFVDCAVSSNIDLLFLLVIYKLHNHTDAKMHEIYI